jgi:hypothetical protein
LDLGLRGDLLTKSLSPKSWRWTGTATVWISQKKQYLRMGCKYVTSSYVSQKFGNLKKKLFFILGISVQNQKELSSVAKKIFVFFQDFQTRRPHRPSIVFCYKVQIKMNWRRRFANLQKYFSFSWHLWRKSEQII